MSARNTFVTKFIYGFARISIIGVALSAMADSLHWHGKQDKSAGYFTGVIKIGPLHEEIWKILSKIRQHYPDFDMAVVCDDWPDVIHAANLEEMGFSLD